MSKIQFRNAVHRDFVLENLDKCKVNDCYHRAFFYVMGISEETRMNIGKMFDYLKRAIQTKVEDPLADEILDGKVKQGDEVVVTMRKGMIAFTVHTS